MNPPAAIAADLRALRIIQGATSGNKYLYEIGLATGRLSVLDCFTVRDLLANDCPQSDSLEALLLLLFMRLNAGSPCLSLRPHDLAAEWEMYMTTGEATGGATVTGATFADAVHTALDENAWSEMLANAKRDADDAWRAAYVPLVRLCRDDQDWLYFHRYFQAERRLERHIHTRTTDAPETFSNADLHDIAATMKGVLGDDLTRPNAEQRLAVGVAMLKSFLILSGGPGTGKTSTIVHILRCLVRSGVRAADIALAAPTGRAAYRLAEAIQQEIATLSSPTDADHELLTIPSQTLHRLLRYNPSRNEWQHHAARPLTAKVLIVDEVSMIDVVLMAQLLGATAPDTKIILVGDQHQLPSVEAGAVLAGLLPQDAVNQCSATTAEALQTLGIKPPPLTSALSAHALAESFVRLTHSHRGTGCIQRFAQATAPRELRDLLNKHPPLAFTTTPATTEIASEIALDFSHMPGDLRRVLPLPEQESLSWQETLNRWCRWHFSEAREGTTYANAIGNIGKLRAAELDHDDALLRIVSAYIDEMKILTLVRRGPYGCDTANRFLGRVMQQRILSRPTSRGFNAASQAEVFAGMPMMITQNDYANELFNGDTGFVVRCRDDDWRVVFRRGSNFVHFALEQLGGWTAAWASTVHKSQGSEYDRVLVGLPIGLDETSPAERLLTSEILYTGITRAKSFAVIFADDETLDRCLTHTTHRQSGLSV